MAEAVSPLDKCTDRAKRVLRRAHALSVHRGHADIQSLDILDALTHDGCVAAAALVEMGYVTARFPDQLPTLSDADVNASGMAQRLMSQADKEAGLLGHHYPGSEHQLLALTAMHPEVFESANAVRAEVLEILGYGPQ